VLGRRSTCAAIECGRVARVCAPDGTGRRSALRSRAAALECGCRSTCARLAGMLGRRSTCARSARVLGRRSTRTRSARVLGRRSTCERTARVLGCAAIECGRDRVRLPLNVCALSACVGPPLDVRCDKVRPRRSCVRARWHVCWAALRSSAAASLECAHQMARGGGLRCDRVRPRSSAAYGLPVGGGARCAIEWGRVASVCTADCGGAVVCASI
jgi:hypothetical protein